MSILNKLKSRFIKPIDLDINEIKSQIYNNKHWHYNTSTIDFSINEETIHIESKVDQISYVNFLEANNSFSTIEEKHNKLIINHHNSLLFKGQATEGLDYIIYLIEYDENNEQTKKHHIQLNQMKSITAQANTITTRLSIRISGKGKLQINDVFISPFLPVKTEKKEKVTDLKKLNIAGILSESSIPGLSDLTQVNALSANTWENGIEEMIPDFVLIEAKELVESEWGDGTSRASNLGRLFLWCETSNIPILFWHKQSDIDPTSFEPLIAKFQFIFTHKYEHYNFYQQHTDSDITQLTPYPVRPFFMEKTRENIKTIIYFDQNNDFSESKNQVIAEFEYQVIPALTADQLLEKVSEGHIVICQDSLLPNEKLSNFVIPFTDEKTFEAALESHQVLKKTKAIDRHILSRHNFKDFTQLLIQKQNIKFENETPTITMYVTIHSREEYRNASKTIEKQTIKNVKWIILIMPFPGYEKVINHYMEHGEIYIHNHALKHRFIKDMVGTTHFGVFHSQQIQDEFFIKDVIQRLEYEGPMNLDVLDEKQRIAASFYVTNIYNKKPLKLFAPVNSTEKNKIIEKTGTYSGEVHYRFEKNKQAILNENWSSDVTKLTKKTILFVSHDFKFIDPFIEACKEQDLNVLIDKWDGHKAHDEDKSLALLAEADIVFCEWGLGNAKFYSEHIQSGQKLYIRVHRQELETDYLKEIDFDKVTNVITISPYMMEEFNRLMDIPREKIKLIPNMMDTEKFKLPKIENANFNLGIIGIIPRLKRLDRAIAVFERLWEEDNRYQLHIKGKLPQDISWMKWRKKEMTYFDKLFEKIENAPWKDHVIFSPFGSDIAEWLTNIGFILSTSDFEAFHLAPMEGIASGAAPIVFNWKGADLIYPEQVIVKNFDEAVERIKYINNNPELQNAYQDMPKRYDIKHITNELLDLMGQ